MIIKPFPYLYVSDRLVIYQLIAIYYLFTNQYKYFLYKIFYIPMKYVDNTLSRRHKT